MSDSEDYFKDIPAIDPGKRHLTRLDNNRILKSIASKKSNYKLEWTVGNIAFMTSYKTKTHPRSFACVNDDIRIQVSVRLILGNNAENQLIQGLRGIEVYYRFLKIIVIIEKKNDGEEKEEGEITEEGFFSFGKNIIEVTEWVGSSLYSSQIASLYYNMLKSIGIDEVKRVLARTQKYKGGTH